MTAANQADLPPPPYTETDIYSVSGGANSRHGDSVAGDDADPAPRSAASSHSDVVFTPPMTPASTHHTNFAGPDLENLTISSSAQVYFESRPAPPIRLDGEDSLLHEITVTSTSSPSDFPYQSEWAVRDVTVQDWQTFVNHLIPHHAAHTAPVDQKLRTEASTGNEGDTSSPTPLAQPPLSSDPEKQSEEWRRSTADIVHEWNDGFFSPRGITIFLKLSPPAAQRPSAEDMHVPGAWDTSFDSQQQQPGGSESRGLAGSGPLSGRRGFRIGGLTVDEDKVSIGDAFVVDRNGVRVGGLGVDGRGVSIGGAPLFGGPHNHGFNGTRGDNGNANTENGWSRGSPWGPFGRGGHPGCGPRGRGGRDGFPGAPFEHRGRRWSRGGRAGRGGHRSRSSSTSSSSSSSSSFSTTSAESVGSLPAYEDLRDSQLPITKTLLQKWLQHPDQPVTKEGLKQVKAEIKAAGKKGCNERSATFGPSSSRDEPSDRAALRAEVKALMSAWKTLKKQQRKESHREKRERRAAHRQRRKERREIKRQQKKERKQARKEGRRGGHHHHPHQHPGHVGGGLWGVGGLFAGPYGAAPGPQSPHVPGAPGVPGISELSGVRTPVAPPQYHPGPFGPRGPPGPGGPFGIFGKGGFLDRLGVAAPPPPPGSWPREKHVYGADSGAGHGQGAQHHGSSAKYAAAEELERDIVAKEAELWKVHESLAREDEENERESGRGKGKSTGSDEKVQSQHALQARTLEEEIESLGRQLERVRMEADEEFARELAEGELGGH